MKTAVIVIDHGSTVKAANDALFAIVALMQTKCPDLIVKGAHMELADPSILDAITACVDDGATHIIAHPFMLSPGRHAMQDIPNLVAGAAKQFSNVTVEVTLPLGCDEKIVDVIIKRCGL